MQQPFLNSICYCELAVKQPIFETLQSCVSTKVTLSHRFKSSPAIPGKVAIPGTAGYLMNAGHFNNSHESSGDLNRGRRTESRVLFGYFLHDAKSDNPFPFREARGSANLDSAYPNNSFPLTKLNPFPKGDSRFCKPRISTQKWRLRTNKLKSFRRPAATFFLLFVKYKK